MLDFPLFIVSFYYMRKIILFFTLSNFFNTGMIFNMSDLRELFPGICLEFILISLKLRKDAGMSELLVHFSSVHFHA